MTVLEAASGLTLMMVLLASAILSRDAGTAGRSAALLHAMSFATSFMLFVTVLRTVLAVGVKVAERTVWGNDGKSHIWIETQGDARREGVTDYGVDPKLEALMLDMAPASAVAATLDASPAGARSTARRAPGRLNETEMADL
jgi:hypothetical protein